MRHTSSNAVSTGRVKRSKYSFYSFYITIFIISLLAVISLLADQSARYHHGIQYGVAQRQVLAEQESTRLVKRDLECRLVHHADDKCAFIKSNCPDEEAGLFSYLSLYYCNLQKVQPIAFIILTLWLGLLFTTIGIAASDFFCINLSTIASILGMSESMAGVTFLAFGNGSPDVFSTFAAMSSHSGSLAVGELIGAAGFITAVVAGSMALVREFKVGKKTFVRDVGFFIVAASFSMVFLADGALYLWECLLMIGFYLFYVVTVVVWHWYLGRRRKLREREAAARGHYMVSGNEELEVSEADGGEDEDAPAGERPHTHVEDFEALERGASPAIGSQADEDSDEDGERGMHLAAEMASSMRVVRPRGPRRNTITPIRPSLVGALEFRSVLSSLQKSRGSHARSIHLRRYSDDPTGTLGLEDGPSSAEIPPSDASSGTSNPTEGQEGGLRPSLPARMRAVSMNDATGAIPINRATFGVANNVPNIGVIGATPTFPQQLDISLSGSVTNFNIATDARSSSPTISLTPPPSKFTSRDPSPTPSQERRTHEQRIRFAPPEEGYPGARHLRVDYFKNREHSTDSPISPTIRSRQHLRLQIPVSSNDSSAGRNLSPIFQFPAYTESPLPISAHNSEVQSLLLPDPAITPESIYTTNELEYRVRRIKWWPYCHLPCPYVMRSSLFPTLCTWRDKTVWDKFVSVISAPSIFLLAVTLPVVEAESQDGPEEDHTIQNVEDSRTRDRRSTIPLLTPDSPLLLPNTEEEWSRYRRSTLSQQYGMISSQLAGFTGHGNTTGEEISSDNLHHSSHYIPIPAKTNSVPHLEAQSVPPRDWNRWLVAVQIFTGPLFVVTIVWANSAEDPDDPRLLLRLVLYSLLGSLVAFGILMSTTTPDKPPKRRFLLCFIGFVVSIAWISTIANEVVGVLKAFGVILDISDAILGLTIFAVGNSLGDLVADITVARLGYPVMALSACFGGPMLNILLGIGISGLYMTITEANHMHQIQPEKRVKYTPYAIEVNGTLMVSGVTLLVTLLGLLIVVPMNKWIMSRRIGWGLIILWSITTVVNLAVEISGVWGD